jgi:HAD superfamily hydrolase (TIGR01509 family)
MVKKYGALFDLDGVLIDSEGGYSEFWAEQGRKYRPDIPNLAEAVKGTTLPNILGTYFPDAEVVAKICADLDEYEANVHFPLFPGVMEFLADLHRHGISAAVVTSSGADKMKKLFSEKPEFSSYFDVVVTSADVTHSKPNPECFLIGAQKLGMEIGDCFIFEDSLNGLKAANAAGALKVVGLSTTLPAEQIEGLANVVIPSFEDFSVDKLIAH